MKYWLIIIPVVSLAACHTCNDALCMNGVGITLDPGRQVGAGEYKIRAVASGYDVTCDISVRDEPLQPGQSAGGVCSNPSIRATLTRGGDAVQCTDTTNCVHRDAGAWPVFHLYFPGTPDELQIRVEGPELSRDSSVRPTYRVQDLDSCGGSCRVAAEAITL
jgi:hypothetical protein